jgi:hypothetical protein
MKKNKHIFGLGALFFVFALIKYAFNAEQLSTGFIVFEILSFLVVLYMVYFVLNFVETCLGGGQNASLDKECIKRQVEINRLKAKLETLEGIDAESNFQQGVESHEMVALLSNQLTGYNNEAVGGLVDVLTKHYEVMAAIGYCSVNNHYEAVKRYGVDEEVQLPDVTLEDGLHAQAIKDKRPVEITDIPADYIEVGSGTGSAKPLYLYILPLIQDEHHGLVLELATFKKTDMIEVWNRFQSAQ